MEAQILGGTYDDVSAWMVYWGAIFCRLVQYTMELPLPLDDVGVVSSKKFQQ